MTTFPDSRAKKCVFLRAMAGKQNVQSTLHTSIRDEIANQKVSSVVRRARDQSLPKRAEALTVNVAAAFAGSTVLAQTLSSAVGAAAVLSQTARVSPLLHKEGWSLLRKGQVWVSRREGEWLLWVSQPFGLTVQVIESLALFRVYRANELCASGALLWRDDAEMSRFRPRKLVLECGQICDLEKSSGVRLRYFDAETSDDGLEVTISIEHSQGCRVHLSAERTMRTAAAASRDRMRQLGWVYALKDPQHQVMYGLGEMLNQLWPLSDAMLPPTPFVTWDNAPSGVGSVLSPVLVSSTGVALVIPTPPSDLQISSNAQIEPPVQYEQFSTDTYIPIYSSVLDAETVHRRQRPHTECPPALLPGKTQGDGRFCAWTVQASCLRASVLVAPEPRLSLVQRQLREWCSRPRRPLRDRALLERVIWSTWAEMKADVNAAKVLEMADRLRLLNLPGGIIEIDDKWQRHYGDTCFDPDKFPDPKQLVDALHARGFLVTLWIPPFITNESDNFAEARDRGLLLGDGQTPLEWWQGRGHLLNVYRPEARAWWLHKLQRLQQDTGIDGFKFDAGEGAFVPRSYKFQAGHASEKDITQNNYTRLYVQMAANFPIAEVRTGWFDSLFEPVVVRLFDKSSKWGTDNGLKSVVTGALTVSLLGAQVVMPDMIGGNAYGNPDEITFQTDADQMRELYIRWLQTSIAMPCVQLSLLPDVFDTHESSRAELEESVVDLVRRFLLLRERYLLPIIRSFIDGDDPILRPVFWEERLSSDHPLRERALRVDDEFLIGNELLVAPVLRYGQRQRSVYIPTGNWYRWRPWSPTDHNFTKILQGPCLIEEQVPLNELLLYRRLDPGTGSALCSSTTTHTTNTLSVSHETALQAVRESAGTVEALEKRKVSARKVSTETLSETRTQARLSVPKRAI
jgi:hypothetical protein